ncbi:RND transporter [Acinetobacter johnsonii]|nr:putative solute-binding protein [Acinetobacter johnsonii]QQT94861.1 RND transporter [Acinetobacter johnsonii]
MVQAKQQVCVFDLLGKAGESYKFLEEWALVSKKWGAQVQLISFQDEDLADKAFQNDKCDAVYMTSMRARTYNKFAGSIDALGGVPSNKIAQKAVEYVLDPRNTKRMTTTLQGESYEVAGIGLIGSAYIFVKDRSLNTIEKAQGKKFAILHYDRAQRVMVERVGAVPVMSDISNFIKKFNTGEVDVVAAPAYAYKPLEIEKGLGSKGAMLNFPVVNVTADLIVRPERFPAQFGEQSRQWFLQKIPQSFAMVQRLEAAIPNKIKMQLSKEDKEKYQRLLRDGRIDLTKQGVYDPGMMRVLKKARCTVERTNFECSLGGE